MLHTGTSGTAQSRGFGSPRAWLISSGPDRLKFEPNDHQDFHSQWPFCQGSSPCTQTGAIGDDRETLEVAWLRHECHRHPPQGNADATSAPDSHQGKSDPATKKKATRSNLRTPISWGPSLCALITSHSKAFPRRVQRPAAATGSSAESHKRPSPSG